MRQPRKPTQELRDKLWGRPGFRWDADKKLYVEDGPWFEESLTRVPFELHFDEFQIHKQVYEKFVDLLDAWVAADLGAYVLSIDRVFELRVHPNGQRLLEHSHGSAFDMNAQWNPNGQAPTEGVGTVLPLVEIAKSLGWWWGGDWSIPAPKHFEYTGFSRLSNAL